MATAYQGLAKDLVRRLKFSGAQAMARTMIELLPIVAPTADTLVIHVPTANGRIRRRGYDQAQLLARRLAPKTGYRTGLFCDA